MIHYFHAGIFFKLVSAGLHALTYMRGPNGRMMFSMVLLLRNKDASTARNKHTEDNPNSGDNPKAQRI